MRYGGRGGNWVWWDGDLKNCGVVVKKEGREVWCLEGGNGKMFDVQINGVWLWLCGDKGRVLCCCNYWCWGWVKWLLLMMKLLLMVLQMMRNFNSAGYYCSCCSLISGNSFLMNAQANTDLKLIISCGLNDDGFVFSLPININCWLYSLKLILLMTSPR